MTKKNIEEMSLAELVKSGDEYEEGIGVEKDAKMAVLFYSLAAKQGNPHAQGRLGLYYIHGDDAVEQNFNEGMRLILLSVEQGNAEAQYSLGYMYEHGIGKVKKNMKEAVKFYQLAANQGNKSAQNKLGNCYENGIIVEKDYKEAVRFYRLAAEQNHSTAQFKLGVMYQEGIKVEKDDKEAVRLYRLVIDQKQFRHPIAEYQLAVYYHDGIGVEKNIKEALRLYRLIINDPRVKNPIQPFFPKAAKKAKKSIQSRNLALATRTRAKAECILAFYYFTCRYGINQDPMKAVQLFQSAAGKEVVPEKWVLTTCYEHIGLMKTKNKRDVNETRYWQTEVEKSFGKKIEFRF